jgi:hypothetical protein
MVWVRSIESAREKETGSTFGLGTGLRLATHLKGALELGRLLTQPSGLGAPLLKRPVPFEIA